MIPRVALATQEGMRHLILSWLRLNPLRFAGTWNRGARYYQMENATEHITEAASPETAILLAENTQSKTRLLILNVHKYARLRVRIENPALCPISESILA